VQLTGEDAATGSDGPFAPSSSSSSTGTASDPYALVTLPMASLEGRPGINGRLWASYLPVAGLTAEEQAAGRAPRGVSSEGRWSAGELLSGRASRPPSHLLTLVPPQV
jgi:cytochrome c biogenesis protein